MTTRSQARVVTFGEPLLWPSAPDRIRLAVARTLDATFGEGDPALPPPAVAVSKLPAGHANGLRDAFKALFGSVLERDVG